MSEIDSKIESDSESDTESEELGDEIECLRCKVIGHCGPVGTHGILIIITLN